MAERDSFFQMWDREQPKFDRLFDALPVDRLDYRPDPRSRSAGEMVTHLAREQEMLVGMMKEGRIDYKDSVPEDFGKMRELWKTCTSELRHRLKNLDDAGWNRPVKFFMGEKLINDTTTHEMLWGFLHDMIHHRGQLSTYVRSMGGKVPSIYGPSADAPPAG
ncbi:MAG TPA: DinB family protein [Thermoanaerobaculia bacterium]|nr:DinB family protein [Thermoanaerobaculia bacterium]